MADFAICAQAIAQNHRRFRSTLPTYLEQVLLSVPGVRGRFRKFGNREMSGRGSFDDGLYDRWGDKGEWCKQANVTFHFFLVRGDIGE